MQKLIVESGGSVIKKSNLDYLKDAVRRHEPDATILADRLPVPKVERMLPVLGEAVGGIDGEYVFNGHILDYVACPPSLANVPNAYSVFVDGESMSPRYRQGETVYVHPGKPPRRGDDVIVQIKPNEESAPPLGYIKEFVGWTGSKLMLRQHNPAQSVEFDRELVVSVHPIVFSGKY
jgi:phage repressor protein C with HTH and peptisase S24 domain